MAVSCLDDPECFRLTNDVVGFTYRVIGTGASDKLAFSHITITSAPEGTVFNQNFSGSSFAVPVDYFKNESKFIFAGINDTVVLGYSSKAQFVSEECGTRFVVSDLNILHYTFDSMRVVNRSPGHGSNARNVEIFRCPRNENTTIAFFQLYDRARTPTALSRPITSARNDFSPDAIPVAGSVSTLTLPLNLQSPSTQYTFIDGGVEQQVTFNYELKNETRYDRCGPQTFIEKIKAVTTYDSVNSMRNELGALRDFTTDPAQVNVRIYKCPVTNQLKVDFKKPAATGSSTVANPVSLRGIRASYTTAVFYPNATNVSSVILPPDPAADATTFFIDYADGTTETIELSYTRRTHTVFKSCGPTTVFSRIKEVTDLPNLTILRTDSVTFPPVTNVEILAR